MKKTVSIIALLVALSPLANAQDESNFYLGARVGASLLDNTCSTTDCTSKAVAGGIIAGYDFANGFSIESTYDYLGDFEIRESNAGVSELKKGDLTTFTLAPKLNFGITENTGIYGKVGAVLWDWNNNKTPASEVSLLTALGLEHRASDLVNLRLEYQYTPEMALGAANANPLATNHHYISAGITFHFGRASSDVSAPVEDDSYLNEEAYDDTAVVEESVVVETEQVIINEATQDASFLFGSDELSAQAQTSLEPMLKRLQDNTAATAVIIGNTDNTGTEEFNEKLSVKRAQTVADYFNNNGITTERMTVTGRGSTDPVATNDTKEGRSLNRRVVVTSPEFVIEQE